jgi:hypothetical protein
VGSVVRFDVEEKNVYHLGHPAPDAAGSL